MPQFDLAFYLSQAFWMLVSFGFLYLLVDYILFPLLDDALSARKRIISENLDAADRANKTAEKMMADYQSYIGTAEREASALLKETYQKSASEARAVELAHDRKMKARVKKAEEEYRQKALALDVQVGALSKSLSHDLIDRVDLKRVAALSAKPKARSKTKRRGA